MPDATVGAELRGGSPLTMRSLLESTWRNVEPSLRGRVGEAAYDSWLAPLRPLAMERGVFHLEAPSRMACDRVESMFRDLVEEELSREFGTRVQVSVAPKPESLAGDVLEVGPERPVIDTSNRTAWLVLQALHEQKELPSPLFYFHGPSGCGKTFLLDAWRSGRKRQVMLRDGQSLAKMFQSAFRDQRVAELREELCEVPELILDEIHRLTGKQRIQSEVARVLERRWQLERPTLIASRWHPRDIRDIEPSLETWLLAGFVCRIELPALDGRLQYLRALEGPPAQNGRADTIERLARDVQGSYIELRRAWVVDRHASPSMRSHYFELIDPRTTFERLRDLTVERFSVTRADLSGPSQKRSISQARKILSWACVQQGLSRAEVGRYLDRTRAAISYGIKALESEMAKDPELRKRAEGLL